jgi:hypothetical protein
MSQLGNAESPSLEGADAIVSNLPFGRVVCFGTSRESRRRQTEVNYDPSEDHIGEDVGIIDYYYSLLSNILMIYI